MKKNYWDRYGINKFYKGNQIKEDNYASTTDFEEINQKDQKKNIHYSKSTHNFFS